MIRLAVLALACGVAACGGTNACGDAEESSASTAPQIEELRLANQLEGDPATLVFAARFSDADGDVRDGEAAFHLNGGADPDVIFDLADVFRQSALANDARGGEIALTLRLVQPVRDGQSLEIGLRLIDAASQPSNCFPLELEFSVPESARLLEQGATELFSWVWPGENER